MDELRELYQEVILDHGKHPRNLRRLPEANRHAHGDNPLCGDRVTVYAKVGDGGRIEDIAFEGRGCAISTASASMMTEILKGKTVAEAQGQTARYLSVFDEYKKAPEVTRKRIFLETMERVLGGTDKVIIDGKSGQGVVPYLPLDQLQQQRRIPSNEGVN